MGGLILMCKRISFLQVFSLFFGTIANIYLTNIYLTNKNWPLLTDLLKVKDNMFLPDNGHTQKRRYSVNTNL